MRTRPSRNAAVAVTSPADHRACSGEQIARLKLNACLRKLGFRARASRCATSTPAGSARGGKSRAQPPGRRNPPSARPSTRDAPAPTPAQPEILLRKTQRRALPREQACEAPHSPCPAAKRCPDCFASSTLSSIAACAGMRSRKQKLKCAQAQSDQHFSDRAWRSAA